MKQRLSFFALALALPLALAAATRPAEPMVVTPVQSTTSRLVYGLLSDSRFAYRSRKLDATMAADVFRRYLEAMDGNKLFFTAADVARLEPLKQRLPDAISSGQLTPALDVFALYQRKVAQRAAYARSLLTQNIFDFTGDDRWYYDREKAPWAANEAELDALWKQSVRNDWLRLKLAGKTPDEIRKTLDKRYAGMITNVRDLNAEDALQTVLNAYTNAIDPHTDYFNPRAAERFRQSMALSLEGIGAVLQKQDDFTVIREIVPGGPAARSNLLHAGDRVVAVGQGTKGPMEDVVGWRIDDVVDKIRGPKDSQVRLNIIPAEASVDSTPRTIVITRDKVKLTEASAKSELMTFPAADGQPAHRIGVIKLPGFYQDFEGKRRNSADYASATRDVARLVREFRDQKVDGIVIDLRNNGGGSLDEAVELTGLFIDNGPVVQVREAGGRVTPYDDRSKGVLWDGPLAVVINRGSASASEIFAGAIQDYGRGLIIGETTFGKGTVQNLFDLDRWPGNKGEQYGQVKFTTAQFFRPGGSSTQHKGVVPDVAFPASVDASEYGESTYDNALPWTQIPALPFQRVGNFAPLLPQLTARHQARSAKDLEYGWWLQDVAQFRSERDKKWISLNEAERRAEREREDAKRKQRSEERTRAGLAADPLDKDALDDGLSANERNVVSQAEREKLADKRPDPLLREAAAILGDAIDLLQSRPTSAQVLPRSTAAGRWTN